MSYCPSNKQPYASEDDAMAEVRRLRRQREHAAARQHDDKRQRSIRDRDLWERAYRCPDCGWWHLTHVPLHTPETRAADAERARIQERLRVLDARRGNSAKERGKLAARLAALEVAR